MKSSSKLLLPGILTVAVILRVLAALYLGDQVVGLPGTADQVSYHALAQRVLAGHGFTFGEAWWPATAAGAPSAHWSYLYTLYLALVYALFGVHALAARLVQAIVVGLLQPYLAYLLAERAFSRNVGLVAAGLTAAYTYFIYYAGALMTEPFYITAILASLYLALRLADPQPGAPEKPGETRLAIALGLTLGAAVLLRQLFLLFAPFLLAWIWWVRRRRDINATLSTVLVPLALLAATILPFTAFNYARFERFVLLNTNAGFAFFWANHPIYGSHFEPILPAEMGSYQSLIPDELRHLDEAALDQELLRRGVGFVLDDPQRYVRLSLSRIPAYFMFWPSDESGWLSNLARVSSFGVLWPFMLCGLLIALARRARPFPEFLSSPILLLIGFCAIYAAIHIMSWALIRYRLPVDGVLLVFAGLTLVEVVKWLAQWRPLSALFQRRMDASQTRPSYEENQRI